MDDSSLSGLLAIFSLITLHALLVMIYAALANVRASTIREMAEHGNKQAKHFISLIASSQMVVTYQLLVMLIRFAIAGIVILNIAQPFLNDNPDMNAALIYIGTLSLTAAITLILGDIVPEAVGSSYANNLAFFATMLMRPLVFITSPIVLLLLRISHMLSALFRSSRLVNTITEEEIMSMVDAGHSGGSIEEEEKDMIYSVLQLDQTRVSEMMIPRIDVVAVEISDSLEQARDKFVESGFSRIPVYENNIDHIRGLLYAKDLLANWRHTEKTIADLMRPANFVPEMKAADELLDEMRHKNVHLSVVVDEYGGTAGLVTIEDIIEEIIGDIRDEYDINEEADYEEVNTDEYLVDASMDLDDFNDLLDIDLPTEDMDTVGGYIYDHFGRVPVIGEQIDDLLLTLTVQSVEGRRIRKVHVIRKRQQEEDEDPEIAPTREATATRAAEGDLNDG